jgi:hypothetical protein
MLEIILVGEIEEKDGIMGGHVLLVFSAIFIQMRAIDPVINFSSLALLPAVFLIILGRDL